MLHVRFGVETGHTRIHSDRVSGTRSRDSLSGVQATRDPWNNVRNRVTQPGLNFPSISDHGGHSTSAELYDAGTAFFQGSHRVIDNDAAGSFLETVAAAPTPAISNPSLFYY